MGNSVALKPGKQSYLSALRLAALASEAGLPEGVFKVVPGMCHTAGAALGLHMDVDCIAFTGSTPTGQKFMGYSGQSNLKQVWPETGGKRPNIIFADNGNLDAAVDMAAFGIFFNQGETCSANSRLYGERSIKDEFVAKLMERTQGMQHPASKMGAMVNKKQTEDVMQFVKAGKATANLVTCGEQVQIDGKGCFVQPAIFDDVSHDDPLHGTKFFFQFCRLSPLMPKTTPFAWPMTVSMASRRLSGRMT